MFQYLTHQAGLVFRKAGVKPELFADVVVHAIRDVPVLDPPGIGRLEIVDAAGVVTGPVRLPKVGNDLLACGVDHLCRYLIASKGRTVYRRGGRVKLRRERIEDGSQCALWRPRLREVSRTL